MPSTTCHLCYRQCTLDEGETGWCGARANKGGQVLPTEFGVISSVTRALRGYGSDTFTTYKPGATSLFLGGLRCSSACAFCITTDVVHAPGQLPWALDPPAAAPAGSLWYGQRALLDPMVAVDAAEHWQCSQILLGVNEPTVTAEWTLQVAWEAKRRGIDVVMQTNGYTDRRMIRNCAHLFGAVNVGIKGSADPEFYERQMRSPGAVPAVLDALQAWRTAGVHTIVADILAPPHQQADEVFRESALRLYSWIAEQLGPLTPVLISPMMRPSPLRFFDAELTVLARPGEQHLVHGRLHEALDIAHRVGLVYAHKKTGNLRINCHGCGELLLGFRERCGSGLGALGIPTSECAMPQLFCPFWSHVQHVTDGRCDHCGIPVPVVALTTEELDAERRKIGEIATEEAMLAKLSDGTAVDGNH